MTLLRAAFDFIITWRETRTRPNAYHFSPNPNDIPKRLIDMRICALLFMASLILSLGLILKCLAILIQLFIQFILLDSVACCTKIGILL